MTKYIIMVLFIFSGCSPRLHMDYAEKVLALETNERVHTFKIFNASTVVRRKDHEKDVTLYSFFVDASQPIFIDFNKVNTDIHTRESFFEYIKSIPMVVVSRGDYSGGCKYKGISCILYDPKTCLLRRVLIFDIERSYSIEVFSVVDIKKENIPCLAWEKSSYSDKQRNVLRNLMQAVDSSVVCE